MNQSNSIDTKTMSVFGDIQPLNGKGKNELMKEYFQRGGIYKTLLGTKKELQEIKDSECRHEIEILRNGKRICRKCNKDFYE
jgi:hypothetical protein